MSTLAWAASRTKAPRIVAPRVINYQPPAERRLLKIARVPVERIARRTGMTPEQLRARKTALQREYRAMEAASK